MEFSIAQHHHLEEICRITDEAKAQLKAMWLDQWQKGYPSREIWINDINNQNAWVALENDHVLGVFAFQTTPDPSYAKIDGNWLSDTPYASMHRVCVSNQVKGQGVAGKLFEFGFEMARRQGFKSMRIDTHPENEPMKKALHKAGFIHCGSIILKGGCEDGDLRIAFEKILY